MMGQKKAGSGLKHLTIHRNITVSRNIPNLSCSAFSVAS